ncbi:MAG: glycerol-3-phosphate responsive antiterminator [Ruminococcaceae bacterium]|nr:glycerol-3-phosphate responsive antiterminator [Oscillospiraceae bacterium]
MEKSKIIAATRSNEELLIAAKSKAEIIFMLAPNIADIKEQAELVHKAGKKFFIHLDLAEGIGKDAYGIRFAKEQGIDGIISTRTNIIKMARKEGVFTVQRFFIVDTHSIDTTIESAKASKADMIEIMPATVYKVVKKLKSELEMPIVLGGLLETEAEVLEALSGGATAISTGKRELWL